MQREKKKLNMAELSAQIVGRPYELGAVDCLAMILFFCDAWAIKLPERFEGIGRKTYALFYRRDPAAAQKALLRFVATLGRKVHPARAHAGDFVIAQVRSSGEIVAAVAAGNGCLLVVLRDQGASIVPQAGYRILRAYRWRGGP